MNIRILRYKARNIIMLLRPQFLVASALMFFIGALAVADVQDVLKAPYLAALAAFVLAQLSAGLINEYEDWEGDRFARKSLFAGGSGEIATGRVEPSIALALAIASVATAAALAIYVDVELSDRGLFLPLFAVSTVLAWCYSVKPVRLMETGAGEALATGLLVWVIPLLSGYLINGSWSADLIPYLVVLTSFCLAAMIGVEFPDKQADIRSGKRNLTYRFGVKRMARVQCVLLISGYAIMVAFVLSGFIGWVNLLTIATALYAWAAVTVMIAPKHYDYEWARSSTTVMMSIFVVGTLLALIDIMLK
jgi:1,4-dihydroxy-2-naphthoate octaprenyltransferase